jgi:hypothetical protein
LTDLGEVWLSTFGEPARWPEDLCNLTSLPHKLIVWTTQLAADGPVTLLLLSRMPDAAITFKDLGTLIANGLATLPAQLNLTRIRAALGDHRSRRGTLTCRFGVLQDLGLLMEQENHALVLTPQGILARDLVRATASVEALESHRYLAFRLATIGERIAVMDRGTLRPVILSLLRSAVQSVWPGRAQWPLWESLLLAGLLALDQQGAGFELRTAEECLDEIHQSELGRIEWAQARRQGEYYFRFGEVHLSQQVSSSRTTFG